MNLDKPNRRKRISLSISDDSRLILEKLAKTYKISQSRAVELIILQAGPKLLTQRKKK